MPGPTFDERVIAQIKLLEEFQRNSAGVVGRITAEMDAGTLKQTFVARNASESPTVQTFYIGVKNQLEGIQATFRYNEPDKVEIGSKGRNGASDSVKVPVGNWDEVMDTVARYSVTPPRNALGTLTW